MSLKTLTPEQWMLHNLMIRAKTLEIPLGLLGSLPHILICTDVATTQPEMVKPYNGEEFQENYF